MSSSENAAVGAASSSTSQSFKYDPLTKPESEIRLLRILPAVQPRKHNAVVDKAIRIIKDLVPKSTRRKGKHKVHPEPDLSSDVHCDIFHVTLDQAPSYKALSYTWGSPNDLQYPIILNGQTISVRENLWLALQQFHTRPTQLVIWIDALCINQTDEVERSEQVTKMKTIYEQAEEVLVWLGPSYEDSHLAFQFMQEMYDHRDDVEWIARRFSQPELKRSLVALDDLINRDYWWRMWIVQELTSAKCISLYCGADAIDAVAFDETQALFRAMEGRKLGFNDDYLVNLAPTDALMRSRLMYRGMYDIRSFQEAFEPQDLSFFQTLFYHWTREATEPGDMVYGLAALANSRSKYQINIDYSLGAPEIYIDLAKKEFQHCKTLEILTRARSGSDLPGLPTWVPDWSRMDDHRFLYSIREPQYAYSAAGESSCDVSISDVGDILSLKGVLIGQVEIVGDRPTMADRHDLENARRVFLSWWALLGTTSDGGERRQEQFGRTLICDMLTDQEHSGWGREEFCRLLVGRFIDAFYEIVPAKIDSELVSAHSWMVQRYKEIHGSNGNEREENTMKNINRSWIQFVAYYIWGRRFFLGSSNIMGLAPHDVNEGDIICVPLGCPHAMIFRKVDDHYIVIGEAYVDGYMRGKAIEMLENGELELETFELH